MNETTVGICCRAKTTGKFLPHATQQENNEHRNPQLEVLNSCHGCRIKAVLEFIESSPIEAITLEAAADVLRISPSRFRHLFKDHVGISFHQYVISLRLERARYLLRTTSYTVERIAGMLGIQDLSHFARDFKRVYGISPGATRCVVANVLAVRNSQNGHL